MASFLETLRSDGAAHLVAPRPHPSLHRVLRPRLRHRRRTDWRQRFLDSPQLLRPRLGQTPGLLQLFGCRRQAGQRRQRFPRGVVHQPSHSSSQPHLWVEPRRAPPLSVALALVNARRPYILRLPHLPRIEVHTHPALLRRRNLGDLSATPPQHPYVPQLDPARGWRCGAETLIAVHGKHGREHTTERRRFCERHGAPPEQFDLERQRGYPQTPLCLRN
ncbi:hypothetical protein SAMN04488690_1617 [Stenotrophomonas indicatrix]|uniref:Uncharacterized protein n=1 Tax=Stenotrophomonas indicatrix TaxID=2045451 RepID=A0A1W1GX42_9GAMM|nr:hypothetical protein SAMN04488690_1617 [Stenotrophomonas indicatrix]